MERRHLTFEPNIIGKWIFVIHVHPFTLWKIDIIMFVITYQDDQIK
jgi:hypothetical protein